MAEADSQDSRFVLSRARLRSLVPRFEEPVAAEFYRLSGKVRVVVTAVLLVINFGTSFSIDTFGLKRAVFWQFMAINTGVLLASMAMTLVIWRGGRSVEVMRRLTYGCLTC